MKKNDSKNEFISLLGRFFTEYLPVFVNASPNTIASYKCAFRLLFQYLNEETDIKIGHITFEALDFELLTKYFDWLITTRKNSRTTAKQRLAALASFADYSESRNLEAGYIFKNSLKKISKKTFRKVKGKQRCSFTRRELEILFSFPDTTEKLGWRDLVLLCVMYSSGARAQEICDLTVKDVTHDEKGNAILTLVKHYCDSAKQAEMYDNLIEVVETEPEETKEPMNYSEEKTFIPEYQELYLQNNDMVGWIKVEDTKINYPVMQSKDNPNFYLKHGFDKAYTDYGCPYVQENCDMELPSDNIIIYGHHMNDGSMFAGLMKFKDKSFWENHKTISFDTLTDRQTYEVIAVFKTVVYTDSPESFKYYQFINAETAEDFTAYVEKCKELSLYDTGVTAEYGDKLLTLSTCEYSRTNGRLVVVAKLINE